MAASVISSTSKWKEFLTRYYKNQIQQLAVSDAKNKALVIEYPHINRFDVRLAEELIASPDLVLAHAEEALTMVDLPVKKEISARVRVAKVPKKTQVRDLRSIDVNRYIAIEGTIRKITDVRPRIIEAAFECARCKNVTIIPQEGGGKFIEPTYCACNEEKKGVFRLLYKESRFEDYQRIKIQESPDELKGGEQPQTLDINVSDDLAGQVTPGEHIAVNGILRSAQKINKDGKTAYFDIYMDGNSIELEEQEYDEVDISPEDEEEIMRLAKDPRVYDKIVYSIAPSIYGYDEVKEAIAHQLFSGVVKSLPDGTRIRGDIHVLLVGDPGIAKSQILRYVVKLAPRGVYASGKSASSAGLTAAAVKDEFDGQWTLEAGALVLADKGVACIAEDQRIVTTTGVRPIKDIMPGDIVVNYSGDKRGTTSVLRVLDNGIRDTLLIDTYMGETLECTPDHQLLTSDGWKLAQALTIQDKLLIPAYTGKVDVMDLSKVERGIFCGFALCDMNYSKKKHAVYFSASKKEADRTQRVVAFAQKYYGAAFKCLDRAPAVNNIRGRQARFSESIQAYVSSQVIHRMIKDMFENREVRELSEQDFAVGFIAGILSTDCCISHKKGPAGVKHTVQIGIGRRSQTSEWNRDMMLLIVSTLHRFGVFATIRGRSIMITSLRSYNRLAEVFRPYMIGANADKLYEVEPLRHITAHDEVLTDSHARWLGAVKFNTGQTVKLGLHSRIYRAVKTGRVTVSLMEALHEHWDEITVAEYREPIKTYLLNPVTAIKPGGSKHVYDLTINGEPNFLTCTGIVHNCIDEMDKMKNEDRSSLHEGMESQTISVAKAGILATLKCRCSILGAANPKLGRFDPYENIPEQINMPPSLMSRFDLIFILQDKPEERRDANIAGHILKSHYAGELNEQRRNIATSGITEAAVKKAMSVVTPEIEPRMLRKYIAYAKRKIFPIMSEEAREQIISFYLSLRKQSEGENASIAITARQLEGLVRLSEASARMRLRDKVTLDDVERTIRIVTTSLRQVGMDQETGKLDIDKLTVGVAKSQRDRIKSLKHIIEELAKEYDGAVPIDAVIEKAIEDGLTKDKVEKELKKLKEIGEIFEPKTGHVNLS